MWCPSATLAVWANSWLAGTAAPDDVLDSLSVWAPRHSVTAYDSAAAGRTGLPWPDLNGTGAVSLLQTLRTAAGPAPSGPSLSVALPVPGDVRGLPAGTQFQRDAIAVGEALIVTDPHLPSTAVGLVPDFEFDHDDSDDSGLDPEVSALSWTVYSAPATPLAAHIDLGEAEYELRSAVRAAAEALGTLRAGMGGGADVDDPRGLVEQALESGRGHRLPEHTPNRAVRVLENAAHVYAIITVSSGLMPIGLQNSSEVQIANDALRPLVGVVRAARIAALTAILHSAWRR